MEKSLLCFEAAMTSRLWRQRHDTRIGCTTYIYTTDENPEKGYIHPRTVKGHEAAAYLTYIVNHYDRLSPFTIFLRGKDEHWHNEAAGPKSSNVLLNLRFEAVRAYGYVNLRCLAYHYLINNFSLIYSELFGESARPRSEYERLLHWAANTTRTDGYGIG
ncbi:hypothetical protein BDV35DRAFT_377627 [Aspergillus flavus]|uniref:Uncharacterized protein n=2 Tax=Aspergillus subgen. Circumdati TaxID=2720871 RepID=A0A5N6H759_ASPFL|nr:hypothetical protein Ao3042_07375 [Aspergillus oryzae 3.042]KAB8250048.1 hypothetical protein BDV35DRAFT_377627 [Aspergillus flavus]KDE85368.1 hypothetical protein AO1008_00897 [Aspergillus oryzae 100-8]|eukprot:EIT76361.1 hypothetical protein Ao3042_07375 [Aspergillus oryzae 3.042]